MRRAALLWGVFVLPGNGALFHAEAERVFPMNHTIHLKKQLRCIYLSNFFSGLRITDAVWVALLAARGFSLWEIGLAESVYHIVSLLCEVPSGMAADLLGRKRALVAGGILAVLSSLLMAFAPGLFLICAAVSAVFRLLSGECAVQQHFHTGHAPAEGTCGHRGTSRPEFPFPARAAGPVRAAGAGQCRRPARLPAGGKTHRCRCVHLCPLLSDQDVPAAAARGAGLAHRVAFSALAAGRCGLRGRYRDRPTGTSPHPAAGSTRCVPCWSAAGPFWSAQRPHGAAFWA